VLLVAAISIALVTHLLTPLDRSTPQASVNGYWQAIQSQDYGRAWQFTAVSRNAVVSESDFISGLSTDDARYGRVISFGSIDSQQESASHALVTVSVVRGRAHSTPIIYVLSLTQYGDVWLIDNVSAE
jgi:hypothetical protein